MPAPEAEEGGLVVFVSDLGEKETLLISDPEAFLPRLTTTDIPLCW